MTATADATGYGPLQIVLHWATAALVLFNYLYSEGMGRALHLRLEGRPATDPGLDPQIHVAVGIAVLLAVVARLGLRYASGAPDAAGQGRAQQIAEWAHRSLYLLLLLVPIAGLVAWFVGIEPAGDAHALFANALMILAGLHALAALGHHFVLRDGVLRRMFVPR
ncbi:cytochrome b/b6 domain-containing protein [Pseudooceanicola sp. CBS1P-1]|uniref:Cytochrome B562 n=1 Tax=Pseudooceanicola albus TaxID=2692189 RepID=A0A6L7G4J5_9RHOB|nr:MULTISPECIES: cytochrome b/b6 domain-containing protein [Pseudooceanicola]MBT9383709.1 cytochrome b/b6 domain-containing protein [Pseudooceanicola endophyticus]MXN17563.1 cytochrome B562 [Pseudooceanicola albus]